MNDPMIPARPANSPQVRSTVSVIAIVAALVSFYFSSKGREVVGLLAALAAIGAGMLGGMRALSPRVSGGMISIIAVVLGVIALVAALIALVV